MIEQYREIIEKIKDTWHNKISPGKPINVHYTKYSDLIYMSPGIIETDRDAIVVRLDKEYKRKLNEDNIPYINYNIFLRYDNILITFNKEFDIFMADLRAMSIVIKGLWLIIYTDNTQSIEFYRVPRLNKNELNRVANRLRAWMLTADKMSINKDVRFTCSSKSYSIHANKMNNSDTIHKNKMNNGETIHRMYNNRFKHTKANDYKLILQPDPVRLPKVCWVLSDK